MKKMKIYKKKMEELNNNIKKELEAHNKKLKDLNELSEKTLKFNNNDFDIDENGIKIKNEEL